MIIGVRLGSCMEGEAQAVIDIPASKVKALSGLLPQQKVVVRIEGVISSITFREEMRDDGNDVKDEVRGTMHIAMTDLDARLKDPNGISDLVDDEEE